MLQRPCGYCGKNFDAESASPKARASGKLKTFCSRTCRNRARSRTPERSAEFFQRPCERCGTVFDSTPSRPRYEPPKRFCPDCFHKGRGEQNRTSTERLCQQCGKPFYVPLCHVNDGRHRGKFCSRACTHAAFREGKCIPTEVRKRQQERRINIDGYVEVFIAAPRAAKKVRPSGSRRHGGWVLEHRYVMEQILGRPLLATETVHHLNGRRAVNDPSNLELWVTPQPTGIRAADLVEYVVRYHRAAVLESLTQDQS